MPVPPDFGTEFRAQLLDLFRWRRDVRRFSPAPLTDGTLERLLGLACLSPSVGLSEPWRFVAVESPGRRAAVRACFESCNAAALRVQAGDRAALYARLKLAGLDEAPCQFALLTDPAPGQGGGLGRQTMPETVEYSAVMALHTIWLAARAEGLGLGWVSILDAAQVKRELDLPLGWRLIGYFCLGYPAAEQVLPELQREGWERRRDPVVLRR